MYSNKKRHSLSTGGGSNTRPPSSASIGSTNSGNSSTSNSSKRLSRFPWSKKEKSSNKKSYGSTSSFYNPGHFPVISEPVLEFSTADFITSSDLIPEQNRPAPVINQYPPSRHAINTRNSVIGISRHSTITSPPSSLNRSNSIAVHPIIPKRSSSITISSNYNNNNNNNSSTSSIPATHFSSNGGNPNPYSGMRTPLSVNTTVGSGPRRGSSSGNVTPIVPPRPPSFSTTPPGLHSSQFPNMPGEPVSESILKMLNSKNNLNSSRNSSGLNISMVNNNLNNAFPRRPSDGVDPKQSLITSIQEQPEPKFSSTKVSEMSVQTDSSFYPESTAELKSRLQNSEQKAIDILIEYQEKLDKSRKRILDLEQKLQEEARSKRELTVQAAQATAAAAVAKSSIYANKQALENGNSNENNNNNNKTNTIMKSNNYESDKSLDVIKESPVYLGEPGSRLYQIQTGTQGPNSPVFPSTPTMAKVSTISMTPQQMQLRISSLESQRDNLREAIKSLRTAKDLEIKQYQEQLKRLVKKFAASQDAMHQQQQNALYYLKMASSGTNPVSIQQHPGASSFNITGFTPMAPLPPSIANTNNTTTAATTSSIAFGPGGRRHSRSISVYASASPSYQVEPLPLTMSPITGNFIPQRPIGEGKGLLLSSSTSSSPQVAHSPVSADENGSSTDTTNIPNSASPSPTMPRHVSNGNSSNGGKQSLLLKRDFYLQNASKDNLSLMATAASSSATSLASLDAISPPNLAISTFPNNHNGSNRNKEYASGNTNVTENSNNNNVTNNNTNTNTTTNTTTTTIHSTTQHNMRSSLSDSSTFSTASWSSSISSTSNTFSSNNPFQKVIAIEESKGQLEEEQFSEKEQQEQILENEQDLIKNATTTTTTNKLNNTGRRMRIRPFLPTAPVN